MAIDSNVLKALKWGPDTDEENKMEPNGSVKENIDRNKTGIANKGT